MLYVLVVSRDPSCKRLYVDNLVRRGYLAVGVTSADEAAELLHAGQPDLVLICCTQEGYQRDVDQLRSSYGLTGTLVLITQDKPDPVWAAARAVSVCLTDVLDPRQLIKTLQPWLSDRRGGAK